MQPKTMSQFLKLDKYWTQFDFALSSLSLLYLYVNVESIFTNDQLCHTLPRQVTLIHELLYILGFDLYTVSMTIVEAT
jgi:hypothetical protein